VLAMALPSYATRVLLSIVQVLEALVRVFLLTVREQLSMIEVSSSIVRVPPLTAKVLLPTTNRHGAIADRQGVIASP
jgi:hypothetical protein